MQSYLLSDMLSGVILSVIAAAPKATAEEDKIEATAVNNILCNDRVF